MNCKHFQVLVTNLLQKHWEWQENMTETVMHGAHRKKHDVVGELKLRFLHVAASQCSQKCVNKPEHI